MVGEEIQACERIAATTEPAIRKQGKEPQTAAALFTRSGGGPTYSYCQQAHSSNSCQVVVHPHACKQALRKAGRCFVCLRRGHISRECRSHVRCPKCGGKHHVSICSWDIDRRDDASSTRTQPSNLFRVDSPSSNAAAPPSTQQSTLNADVPTFTSSETRLTSSSFHSLWVTSNHAVLLQTAQAQAFNPDVSQKT